MKNCRGKTGYQSESWRMLSERWKFCMWCSTNPRQGLLKIQNGQEWHWSIHFNTTQMNTAKWRFGISSHFSEQANLTKWQFGNFLVRPMVDIFQKKLELLLVRCASAQHSFKLPIERAASIPAPGQRGRTSTIWSTFSTNSHHRSSYSLTPSFHW